MQTSTSVSLTTVDQPIVVMSSQVNQSKFSYIMTGRNFESNNLKYVLGPWNPLYQKKTESLLSFKITLIWNYTRFSKRIDNRERTKIQTPFPLQ